MASSAEVETAKEFHVAPMIHVTYREFRYFCRLLSRRAVLWTEMIVDDTILHSDDLDSHLYYDSTTERPIICQIGGSCPDQATQVTRVVTQQYGYPEINLNAGCPSNRVASERNFGAALLQDIDRAVEMLSAMQEGIEPSEHSNGIDQGTTQTATTTTPVVSIKLRIGVDYNDDYAWTVQLIERLSKVCRRFYVHARKLHSHGLDPAQNRRIPPLNYPRVYALCRRFPDCDFWINGGIMNIEQARKICYGIQPADNLCECDDRTDSCSDDFSSLLPCGHGEIPCSTCQQPYGSCITPPLTAPSNLRGCLVGRAMVDDPMRFATLDTDFFGASENPHENRREILEAYATYLESLYPRRCGDDAEKKTRRPGASTYQPQTDYYCPLCKQGQEQRPESSSSASRAPRMIRHVVGRALKPAMGSFAGLPGLAKTWRRLLHDAFSKTKYLDCGPSFALRQALDHLEERHPDAAAMLDRPFLTRDNDGENNEHISTENA